MDIEQMQSLNRRRPKQYESWAQRAGAVQFIELRSSKYYPLTHHPYGDRTYTAYGTEYPDLKSYNDLTTYVR